MEPKIKQKGSVSVLKWKFNNFDCTYYKVQDNDMGPILYANCATDRDHNKQVSFTLPILNGRLEPYLRATRVIIREIANDNKGHRLVVHLVDASKVVSLVAKELTSLGFEVNNISPQELVGTREIM